MDDQDEQPGSAGEQDKPADPPVDSQLFRLGAELLRDDRGPAPGADDRRTDADTGEQELVTR